MSVSKERMSKDSRTLIIEQALTLFAKRGYENVGVQEIVQSVDLSKPTLYHYFGSKRGLLAAILAEKFAPLQQDLDACANQRFAAIEHLLTEILRIYFEFVRAQPEFFRMYLAMIFAPEESDAFQEVCAHAERQHRAVAAMIARFAPPASGDPWAASFIGMFNNHVTLFFYRVVRLDENSMQMIVHRFLYGAIGIPPNSR